MSNNNFVEDTLNNNGEGSKDLIEIGEVVLAAMTPEQIDILASKSHTLHFNYALGLASQKQHRTIGITDKITHKKEFFASSNFKIVGFSFKSDMDIEVPVIDVTKDHRTGFDFEKDVTYVEVSAGTEFYLTSLEAMVLLIQDEYAGLFEANGQPLGGELGFNSKTFKEGKTALPTPVIKFYKGNGSIKDSIVQVDQHIKDVWSIIPGYEKFESLIKN